MTNNKKIILGFTGLMASGKSTAAKYIKEKYGANTYRFSTALRDVLDRLYLPHKREHMQKLSTVLRESFGEEVLAKIMAEDVKNDPNELVVVEGIRRPGDVEYLKQNPGFVLVEIFTDIETSLTRLNKRGENPDDATKTLEKFKKDQEQESELKITEISKEATERINNNGSLEDLNNRLDELVKKYESKN